MRKLIALLALSLGMAVMVAAPAQAGTGTCIGSVCYGGKITVPADPPGAGRGVIITCNWGNPNGSDHVVKPGTTSRVWCFDADGVYVATGREIRCKDSLGIYFTYRDATGWYKIDDLTGLTCYDRAD